MNEKHPLTLFLACLLLCCGLVSALQAQENRFPADSPRIDKANWMGQLADTIAASHIVLPGTHDS